MKQISKLQLKEENRKIEYQKCGDRVVPKIIYGIPAKDFVSVIQKIDSLKSVSDRLDYYLSITGRAFDDTTEVYVIDNETCYWTVHLFGNKEFSQRAMWFINKYFSPLLESELTDFIERFAKCNTETEKADLCNAELSEINRLANFPPISEGYNAQKRKIKHEFDRRETLDNLNLYCYGMRLYQLELLIKGLLSKKDHPHNSRSHQNTLFPKGAQENETLVFNALKVGRIIDNDGKVLPVPRGRSQYLIGIIDSLKEFKIINDHPRDTLHKLVCQEILKVPYTRVSVKVYDPQSSYNKGKAETTSYLISIGR